MPLDFNLDEQFPHLSKAPIVEAVLQVNARATSEWSEEIVIPRIQREVGGGVALVPEKAAQGTIKFDPVGFHNLGTSSYWQGVRIDPGEHPEIIRFARDFFSYSRLAPYEHWAAFLRRAMHFLDIHIRVAQPGVAQRIGLRFVNRVAMSPSLDLEDYLVDPPRDASGLDLPISAFLYHTSYVTPNYPYAVSLGRTVQQTTAAVVQPPALIIDLDVSTVVPSSCDRKSIEGHLHPMRWLKNKVFFGIITRNLLERLK